MITNSSLNPLTPILLTWRIWWAPKDASRWQIGFNSTFKRLRPRGYFNHYWPNVVLNSTSAIRYITLLYDQKLALMKQVFYGYFVCAEHECDIRNCCLALVSKIQEAAFMYSAFRFQSRVWVTNDNHEWLTLWLVYMIRSSITGD